MISLYHRFQIAVESLKEACFRLLLPGYFISVTMDLGPCCPSYSMISASVPHCVFPLCPLLACALPIQCFHFFSRPSCPLWTYALSPESGCDARLWSSPCGHGCVRGSHLPHSLFC